MKGGPYPCKGWLGGNEVTVLAGSRGRALLVLMLQRTWVAPLARWAEADEVVPLLAAAVALDCRAWFVVSLLITLMEVRST
jgi:hypothetical protein